MSPVGTNLGELDRGSRAAFLRRAAAGGVAALGALAAAGEADAATSAHDVAILNYALTLEYLQAAFYTEAEHQKALRGRVAAAATAIGTVERAHVAAFRRALGSAAVRKPAFDFDGATEDQSRFVRTAVALEDLAVAAYKAQLPRIESPAVLAVAVSIHSVEARHAAWLRRLAGVVPVTEAFDEPVDKPEIQRLLASTRLIVSAARTQQKGKPRFAG